VADEFLSLFNFEVHLSGSDDRSVPGAAFSEVSGLEINLEHREIREGGYNRGMRQLVGRTSHAVLVLKRGLTLDGAFWEWIQQCIQGIEYPLPYMGGDVFAYPASGDREPVTAAQWRFTNGIVTRVKASDLNANSANSVPIEELHIAHEGLRRER
jgi:phage tail-like protein